MSEKKQEVATVTKDITVKVLEKVSAFQESGELVLPKDYNPANALKSAYLMLNDLKDKDGKPALEVCTPASIAQSLLSMVVWGLSPIKTQVYFIVYGNQLQITKSYMGNIAIARRVANVNEVRANVIYDGDDFDYEIDVKTGRLQILKHKPSLSNIDDTKIKGAYAVVNYADGSTSVEVMNFAQIQKAWNQGKTKGNSPAHSGFAGEMAKKSVINRALKVVIGSSDDSNLYEETEPLSTEQQVKAEISQNANTETIDFEEVTTVETATPAPEKVTPKDAVQTQADF